MGITSGRLASGAGRKRRLPPFRVEWGFGHWKSFWYLNRAEDFFLEKYSEGFYPRMLNTRTDNLMYSENPMDDGRVRIYDLSPAGS